MKSRILRIGLLVIAVLALTVSLAACGPNTPATEPSTDPTTKPTTAPTTAPSTAPTTAPTPTDPATYTITYVAGEGATGTYPAGTYTKDAAVTLPDGGELTKENHTFSGWTDGTNTYGAGAAYTMPANDVTLTAVWTENTYTLTFAAGEGATGTYPAGTYTKDAAVTLPDGGELTKENHTFGGWTDGTNTYAAGAAYTMPANDVTLSAVWIENTYTLTFAAGDGATGSYPAAVYAKDAAVTLPDGAELAKENHTFSGWTDGTNTYEAGAAYTMPANDVTLTAVWTENAGGEKTDDVIKTYTSSLGEEVDGKVLLKVAHNETQNTITVTYTDADGEHTASYTLVPDGYGDWEIGEAQHVLGSQFSYLSFFGDYCMLNNAGCVPYATFELQTGGEGGNETADVIHAYTNPTGEDTAITRIVHNVTQATITVTYDYGFGPKEIVFHLTDAMDGDWTVNEADTEILGSRFAYVNFAAAGELKLTNEGCVAYLTFTLEGEGGNEGGGDETTDAVKIYTSTLGEEVDSKVLMKVVYDETQNTITVTYTDADGEHTETYTLVSDGYGDWEIGEAQHVLGSRFSYLSFFGDYCMLNNNGGVPYAMFELQIAEEGGNEGGGETTDAIKVFTHEGAQINGHIVTKIEYNQAQDTITVTYDGSQTVTYQLSDWGDGDWRINETTIFGSLYCITILPVDNATTCKVDLSGYGAKDVVFMLEGDTGAGGEDVDKVYEIVTTGPYAVTKVAGNTINKLVYNAANATMVVTYNGDQTVTYTLKVGKPVYDLLDAWTIVEADHIFTANFAGFVIEEENISLYVGYDVLNFALVTSGDEGGNGDSGESEGGNGGSGEGTGGGTVSGVAIYKNGEGVEVNGYLITEIEFNQYNGAILVTYDDGETATYAVVEDGEGGWTVLDFSHIFGSKFGWLEISSTELRICDYNGAALATFYIEA